MSNKKIVYVLMVSIEFPRGHYLAGYPTRFPKKIREGIKIHTLRKNYELWRKRFQKIDAGEAVLSLRTWSGVPYQSKQVEFAQLDKTNGIGLQKAVYHWRNGYSVNKNAVSHETLAKNDGLQVRDFVDWFKNVEHKAEFAVIHFTPFRY